MGIIPIENVIEAASKEVQRKIDCLSSMIVVRLEHNRDIAKANVAQLQQRIEKFESEIATQSFRKPSAIIISLRSSKESWRGYAVGLQDILDGKCADSLKLVLENKNE